MSSKEVSKINIKIKINGLKISLTLAEAKELQEILNETFGKGLEPSFVWTPISPIIIERPVIPRRDCYEITFTCDNITLPHQTNANANGGMIVAVWPGDVSMDVVLEGEEEYG